MKFSSLYDHHKTDGIEFVDVSMTHQSFKDECDINNIIARYDKTGFLVDPSVKSSREALFGDFSDIPDYQVALDYIQKAGDLFADLPSKVRREFDNDPGKFLDYCSDMRNYDRLVELGLVDSVSRDPVVDPPKVAKVEPDNGDPDS